MDEGSLTAATDALDVSQPSVVRLLASLERALGARLLNRTTRRMALTMEGRDFYERCKRILAEVEEASAVAGSGQGAPRGELRVTASTLFGRLHVAPLATEFVRHYSGVSVDLMLVDRVVNLVDEGLDVGVRIADLPDSSLIAVSARRSASNRMRESCVPCTGWNTTGPAGPAFLQLRGLLRAGTGARVDITPRRPSARGPGRWVLVRQSGGRAH